LVKLRRVSLSAIHEIDKRARIVSLFPHLQVSRVILDLRGVLIFHCDPDALRVFRSSSLSCASSRGHQLECYLGLEPLHACRTCALRSSTKPEVPVPTCGSLSAVGFHGREVSNLFTYPLSPNPFLSLWTYYAASDLTNGQVNYLSKAHAVSRKLAYVQSDGTVVLAVDSKNDLAFGAPRDSCVVPMKFVEVLHDKC